MRPYVLAVALLLTFGAASVALQASGQVGHAPWPEADGVQAGNTGDVNCSGSANVLDAHLIMHLYADKVSSLPCQESADVNLDGQIDLLDSVLVAQFDVGVIDTLPSAKAGPTPTPCSPMCEGVLQFSSTTFKAGDKGTIDVLADLGTNLRLSAWVLDAEIEGSAAALHSCFGPPGSSCHADAKSQQATILGLTDRQSTGVTGRDTVGKLVVRCLEPGTAALHLQPRMLADATAGNPQPLEMASVSSELTCERLQNVLEVGSATVPIGQRAQVAIVFTNPTRGIHAWSFGVAFPSYLVRLAGCSTHPGGSCLGSSGGVHLAGSLSEPTLEDVTVAVLDLACLNPGGYSLDAFLDFITDKEGGSLDPRVVRGAIQCIDIGQVIGDVDCDGAVSSLDALLILQLVSRLAAQLDCGENADVNVSLNVTSIDALLVLQSTARLVRLPV